MVFAGLLGAFAIAAVIPVLFPPRHRESPGSVCLSQIKMVGNALLMYGFDHDDRWPIDDWMDSAIPYVKEEVRYDCPLISKAGQRYGYALNLAVAGKDIAKVDDIKTAALFETDALGRSVVANLAAASKTRHRGKSVVSFVDSSARMLTPQDWKSKVSP